MEISGKDLKKYRLQNDISQGTIASALGVTIGAVSQWEISGKITKDRQITLSVLFPDIKRGCK